MPKVRKQKLEPGANERVVLIRINPAPLPRASSRVRGLRAADALERPPEAERAADAAALAAKVAEYDAAQRRKQGETMAEVARAVIAEPAVVLRRLAARLNLSYTSVKEAYRKLREKVEAGLYLMMLSPQENEALRNALAERAATPADRTDQVLEQEAALLASRSDRPRRRAPRISREGLVRAFFYWYRQTKSGLCRLAEEIRRIAPADLPRAYRSSAKWAGAEGLASKVGKLGGRPGRVKKVLEGGLGVATT
jgi:hypothetical protein